MPRLRAQAFALGAAALLLSACATVEPEPAQLSFALPAEFAAHPGEAFAGSEHWWQGFGDARLDQFVTTALQSNPALAQALARVRIAEAQARVSRADRWPQISLGSTHARQRQNLEGMLPGLEGSLLSNNHDLTLDVSWELDLWGRLAAMSAASRTDFLASAERLRGMRQSVAAQVAQLYFEIVHARAQVDLSTRTVEVLQEMARQIDNRVAVGIASPADAMLANANLESARAGLEQRSEALQRSLRQLEVQLGGYPLGTLQTSQQLPSISAPPATGVPAELLARRPDVRAAELAVRSAGYQLGAAERSLLPSIALSGSGGFSSSELSDLFGSDTLIWSIAGRILQPVFQGGRLVAQVDIAGGQREEALHAYGETALTALAEVESALVVEKLLARRERAREASASAAEQAVTVSFNRYLQGIDPFLNVLESQQRALDGRSAQISAHHAQLENRIALHLALGGGFDGAAVNPRATSTPPAATDAGPDPVSNP